MQHPRKAPGGFRLGLFRVSRRDPVTARQKGLKMFDAQDFIRALEDELQHREDREEIPEDEFEDLLGLDLD